MERSQLLFFDCEQGGLAAVRLGSKYATADRMVGRSRMDLSARRRRGLVVRNSLTFLAGLVVVLGLDTCRRSNGCRSYKSSRSGRHIDDHQGRIPGHQFPCAGSRRGPFE